ncbi:putative sporulation protein YtxC [Bacillus sp. CLL-7-23]|uniref:Sporulation protein YtxC n=1 Tax=Bacillus changyiensis TaxID=3004103 RepID=A0ABT4X4F3_9BACI|nr:putative sporulation protein YtxC [Bacillus changyiensis]MDA7027182.1 putative sporulation protein YtxC [Bacillus changyiensis]
MLEITFEDDYDTAVFLHLLRNADVKRHIKVHEAEGKIGIEKTHSSVSIQTYIQPILTKFFIECKEDEYMLSVIEGDFFYLDRDEQQQILQLAHSIMEGELEGLPLNCDHTPREEYIFQELQTICLEETVFSIRSFMTFRLGKYYQRLREYIVAAIDEYKMEQEYQTFIQSLRDYVTGKKPMIDHVHIVHDGQFVIWELKFISEREQKKYMDRRFVREHPMYIDSHLLAPLVSIAPRRIDLYTRNREHGMIQTIQNIFQERVKIFSLDSFPAQENIFEEYS